MEFVKDLFIIIALLVLSFVINLYIGIYGWGLTVHSMKWLIGGFISQLFLVALMQLLFKK
jgi:hypothetical protein